MMKKIFVTLAAAGTVTLGLVSCASKGNKQAMQEQQHTIDSLKTEMVKKQIIDSMSEVAKHQAVYVNQEMMPVASPAPDPVTVVKHEVRHTTTHKKRSHSNSNEHYNSNSNSDYAGNNNYQESAPAPAATPVAYAEQSQPKPQKKGWSSKATGSLIGAGAGAAAGALIGKKKGLGALIGGAVGAAAGLGTGAIIDHRNGR